ncbi:MAG: DUF1858 domain-containing protein [Bacteroidetes bacterium]|nr:DUF1858 domain-containing protein [Bacteroidota bacterium]MCW5895276.1 DUF1858 domain-containing protein [Bacteroidota bacterium]
MTRIERTISIEELIDLFPGSVKFLISRNLPCLVCGEPTWGTLEELALDKGWTSEALDALVYEMNRELVEKEMA